MAISLRFFRALICLVMLAACMTSLQAQTNYYWNGGSVTSVTSWGLNLDGSGVNPTNFTTASQIFNIQTGQTPSTAIAWTISGAGSGLLVQSGGSFTSSVNNTLTVSLQSSTTYNQTGTHSLLSFGTIDPGSTFVLNTSNTIRPTLTYGGFTWNVTSATQNPNANLNFTGNMRQSGSSELRFTNTGNVTVAIGRDLVIDSTRTINTVNGASGVATLNIGGGISNSGTLSSLGTSAQTNINFTGTGSSNATFGTIGTIGTSSSINFSVSATKTLVFQDTLTTTSKVTLTNAGTVQLGTGGTAGGLTGNMINNGILVINRSDPYSLGGNISGSGSLQQIGGGTTTLGGTNTYAGTTTVTNGFIAINDEARLGAVPGTLTANQITLNGGGVQAISTSVLFAAINKRGITLGASGGTFDSNGQGIASENVITGAGSLTKIGTSSLSLYAANTYGGDTNIQNGSLVLYSQSGSSTNRLPTTTVLTLGSGSNSGLVSLGHDAFTGASDQTIAGLTTSGSGTGNAIIGNTAANSTLTVNNSSNFTYSGTIGGAGTNNNNLNLVKSGSGTQIFSGNNTYTGTTLVTAGKLFVNGTHTGGGTYTVDTGGTLGGNGTINANVNVVTGTLAPGNSPDRLTINGAVAFTNTTSSVFSVEINGPNVVTDYDQLRVGSGGSLNVTGATLAASLGFDPVGIEKIFITDDLFAGSVTGTFNNLPEGASIMLTSPSMTVYTGTISYLGDFPTDSLLIGNDIVIYNLTAAIPEPGTLALVGLTGFFGVQWYLRRKPVAAKKDDEKSEGEATAEPAPVEATV